MKYNIKFHKMGTSNGTQLNKLQIFKGVDSFWCKEYGNSVEVYNYDGDELIKSFSKSNFNQLILVWQSFGILERETNNNYVFETKENSLDRNIENSLDKITASSLDKITKNILTPEQDKDSKIQIYKDSRIISFLKHIKYINNQNIHLFKIRSRKYQSKIIKDVNYFNMEISWWEKEVAKDEKKLYIVLERIWHEWKW